MVIPFLNDVVQGVYRSVLFQLLHIAMLIFVKRSFHLFHESLEIPKLVQKWLMGQEGNVLGIVKGSVRRAPLVHFLEVFWFVWVDPFEDAEPSSSKKGTSRGEKKMGLSDIGHLDGKE